MINIEIINFEDGIVTAKVTVFDGTGRTFSIKFNLETHEIYTCNTDIKDHYVERAVFGLYRLNKNKYHGNFPKVVPYAWC